MTAVVLVNLGTPTEPTARAVRPFLREFLSDRRVIEMHPALWRPILAMILARRPRQSAEKYAAIWSEHGSPLLVHSRAQRTALAARLDGVAEVRLAMRYGEPSVGAVLDELYAAGHRQVLVVPLYPQYSASSTGTVLDEVYRHGLRSRDQLELRTVRSFPDDPAYVRAVTSAIEASWAERGRPDFAAGDRLVLSFHSIPVAMHEAGDPYRAETEATAAAVGRELGVPDGGLQVTYQSVFGPAAWLTPATIDRMAELGAGGTRRVDVVCPGFTADCLETLEEIELLNREAFTAAGGADFTYIPWGNDRVEWTDALGEIAERHLAGWARTRVG
ncbi:MAG: ferrochelatase [Cellulomonadaceae bacterium]